MNSSIGISFAEAKLCESGLTAHQPIGGFRPSLLNQPMLRIKKGRTTIPLTSPHRGRSGSTSHYRFSLLCCPHWSIYLLTTGNSIIGTQTELQSAVITNGGAHERGDGEGSNTEECVQELALVEEVGSEPFRYGEHQCFLLEVLEAEQGISCFVISAALRTVYWALFITTVDNPSIAFSHRPQFSEFSVMAIVASYSGKWAVAEMNMAP